jgi:hypothetical protein
MFWLRKKDLDKVVKIIHEATLADSWKDHVSKILDPTDKAQIIPKILSAFYTLSPTQCNYYKEEFEPFILQQLRLPEIKKLVLSYNALKQNETPVPVTEFDTNDKNPISWDDWKPENPDVAIENVFEFQSFGFNIPILLLFTHIGIRVCGDEETKTYCLWPACQPHINNREIPMDWIWDKTDRNETGIINGIVKRGDLGWSAQKVNFLPYEVIHGSNPPDPDLPKDPTTPADEASEEQTQKEQKPIDRTHPSYKETKLVNVIAQTTSNTAIENETETKDDSPFDGNLHARLCSFEVAVDAYEAIAVSCTHIDFIAWVYGN